MATMRSLFPMARIQIRKSALLSISLMDIPPLTAGNGGKKFYRFYYGYTDLDSILGNGALEVSNVRVGD